MSIHPEMQAASPLLARLLLGDQNSAREVASELTRARLWRPALAISAIWGVVPQLNHSARAFWTELEPGIQDRLKDAAIAATAQSMLALHRCSTILERLDNEGVTALAFKGIGLIGNLYETPAERMVKDIDLLIDPRNVKPAYEILRSMGFSPETDPRLHNYVAPLDNWSLSLVDRQRIEVDLHWRIGDTSPAEMTAEKILSRAETVKTLGITRRVACPMDAIMLTIHHSCADFVPASVVRDLCDLAQWWDVQPGRWNVDNGIAQARVSGLTVPCLAMWNMLVQLNEKSPAVEGVKRLRQLVPQKVCEDARKLGALFDLQLREGVVGSDVLNFLMRPLSINRNIVLRIQSRGPYVSVAFGGRRESMLSKFTKAYQALYDLVRVYPRQRSLYHALFEANRRYE